MTGEYDYRAGTDPASRAAELEREVRQSRAEAEDEQNRQSYGETAGRVGDYVRDTGGTYARSFGQMITRHPVPAALVGVGLVWILLSARRHNGSGDLPPEDSFDPDWPEVGAGAEQFSSETGGRAGGVRERAGSYWHAAKRGSGRLSRLAGSARERAASMSERARRSGGQGGEYGERARETFSQTLERQPLVLAAIGLAAGALLGAALPATRREDELLGATSDRLKERAWAAGREGYDRAGAAAGAAYSAAAHEVKEKGPAAAAAAAVRHKFEDAAEAAAEAAKRELDPRRGRGEGERNRGEAESKRDEAERNRKEGEGSL